MLREDPTEVEYIDEAESVLSTKTLAGCLAARLLFTPDLAIIEKLASDGFPP